MESSIRTAVAGLVATTRAKASRPREQRTRPGADRPTLLLLVALGLGGVLVALARTTTEPASITNVQVANADPRRPATTPCSTRASASPPRTRSPSRWSRTARGPS